MWRCVAENIQGKTAAGRERQREKGTMFGERERERESLREHHERM